MVPSSIRSPNPSNSIEMSESRRNTPVAVSCGTRFHSDYLSHHLWRIGRLDIAITGHSYSRYTTRIELPTSHVHSTFPFFYISHAVNRINGSRLQRLNDWLDECAIAAFDRRAASHCTEVQALVCWSRSSVHQMRRVRANGGVNIIERVGSDTLFQHRILSDECDRLGIKPPASPSSFTLDRESEEYELADAVLCPSNHVRDSLRSRSKKVSAELIINRYGVNEKRFFPSNRAGKTDGSFEVLFVGTIGVRKGCGYLLRAAKHFQHHPKIKFTLIGPVEPAFEAYLGKHLDCVNWKGPVPNRELAEKYREASIFLFPSLDEGMAYVQMEAQACGLPLISTRNAGGDHLIDDGINGFVVPTHDAAVLIARIEQLFNDRELFLSMCGEAITIKHVHTWRDHATGVASCVDQLQQRQGA